MHQGDGAPRASRAPALMLAAVVSFTLLAVSARTAPAGSNVWTGDGPTGSSVLALAIDPGTPATVYAAAGFDGVFKSTDGGRTWAENSLLGTYFRGLAIDPTAAGTLYAATGTGCGKCRDPSSVFKSVDGGMTWNDTGVITSAGITTEGPVGIDSTGSASPRRPVSNARIDIGIGDLPFPAVVGTVVDPATPSTLYAAITIGGVRKSTDGAGSWRAVNVGLGSYDDFIPSTDALVLDPVTTGTLYAATPYGIFQSSDAAGSWQLVSSALTSTRVGALAIDPIAPGRLYAGTLNGVYKSTDGAKTWVAVNDGLTVTDVTALEIDPLTSSTLYAASNGGGVFKTEDGARTWSSINSGLTNLHVAALAIDPLAHSTLYAGTLGDGVFTIEQLPPSCVGDCTSAHNVAVDDLITLVNIALGTTDPAACQGGISIGSRVTVAVIIQAANNALNGCGRG